MTELAKGIFQNLFFLGKKNNKIFLSGKKSLNGKQKKYINEDIAKLGA